MHRTARYTAVALGGLALDAAVVVAGLWAGLPLWGATLLGYSVALVATYLAHERWTLGVAHPAAGRFALYLAICTIVGIGRAGMAHGLAGMGLADAAAWGVSVGASFVANAALVLAILGKSPKT